MMAHFISVVLPHHGLPFKLYLLLFTLTILIYGGSSSSSNTIRCIRNDTHLWVEDTNSLQYHNREDISRVVALFRFNCQGKALLGLWLRDLELSINIPTFYPPCMAPVVSARCYFFAVDLSSRSLKHITGGSVVTTVTEVVGRVSYVGLSLLAASLKRRKLREFGVDFEEFSTREKSRLSQQLAKADSKGLPIRVVVGSGNVDVAAERSWVAGWILTDRHLLDLTNSSDFEEIFGTARADMFLAEHVLEHLLLEEIALALALLRRFLRSSGKLRLAVPDIFRINAEDIEALSKDFLDGHFVQLSHEYLQGMLQQAGFWPDALEFEEQRQKRWVSDAKHGRIQRCSLHDRRGAVSVVFDAFVKPPLSPDTNSRSQAVDRLRELIGVCFERTGACTGNTVITLGLALLAKAWHGEKQISRRVLRELAFRRMDVVNKWMATLLSGPDAQESFIALWDVVVDLVHASGNIEIEMFNLVKAATDAFAANPSTVLEHRCERRSESQLTCRLDAAIPGNAQTVCLGQACHKITRKGDRMYTFDIALNTDLHGALRFYSRAGLLLKSIQADAITEDSPPLKASLKLPSASTVFKSFQHSAGARKPDLVVVTLVLNGMPFIRHHIDELTKLDLAWQWHIIEGVAAGRADRFRPYSTSPIPDSYYTSDGRSVDGTSSYIDSLAQRFLGKVFVHRRALWRDKVEMMNVALAHVSASILTGSSEVDSKTVKARLDTVLMEIDVDELWTANQISTAYALLRKRRAPCAYFHCHFHITPELLTATKQGYSHRNEIEWLRMWVFQPGMLWVAHAPPKLAAKEGNRWILLEGDRCLQHNETAAQGLVFTHHAYSTEKQVAFKEKFYGYKRALAQWRVLRKATSAHSLGVNISSYLDWVGPRTVMAVGKLSPAISPSVPVIPLPAGFAKPHLVVDGVVFQVQPYGGISRVWRSILPLLLAHLAGIGWDVTVIVRGDDALPFAINDDRFVGKVFLPPYIAHETKRHQVSQLQKLERDEVILGEWMLRLNATVFLSTLYTTAPTVINILLVHDMIPEEFGWDLTQAEWLSKKRAIERAHEVITVSPETSRALRRYYPRIQRVAETTLSFNKSNFYPRENATKGGYLLVVGPRQGYKGSSMLFRAIQEHPLLLQTREIALVGTQPLTPQERATLHGAGISFVHHGWVSDKRLGSIYASARALLYLSVREGFGLPALEAMACGCPVVLLSTNKATVEVIGREVGFVVNVTTNSEGLLSVINQATTVSLLRHAKVRAGILRAQRWPKWQEIARSIGRSVSSFRLF